MRIICVVLLLSLFLITACDSPGDGITPTATPIAAVDTATAVPAPSPSPTTDGELNATATVETIPTAAEPTSTPEAEAGSPTTPQTVEWEGLTIAIPANHRWEIVPPTTDTINGSTVLAEGRIAFAGQPDAELPDGITFTIVNYSGTTDEWLAQVVKAQAGVNPVDPNTIGAKTIAGRSAIVYSNMAVGVSRSENYIVSLDSGKLLLILDGDADNADYSAVLDALRIR